MDNQDKPLLSQEEMDLLKQAQLIMEFSESQVYKEYLKGYLLNLAQEGYPNPKDYQDKEKLIIDYTQAVGRTESIKTFIDFIEQQKDVVSNIKQKLDNIEKYKLWKR